MTSHKCQEHGAITAEDRLRTLVDASPDPVYMKDGNGCWLEVNPAGLELFQLEHVDYRGKTEDDLAEYSPFYKEALLYCRRTDASAWEKGELSRNEERIPRPNGTIRTYDVLKIPLFHPDGTRKGLLILGRDITERKLAEEERDRLLEQARDAIVARDDFLSIASHELRTPCTSLRLGIEALLRHARQSSFAQIAPAFLERMLVASDRQSKHLLYLIDRLLDVSRFDNGQLDLNYDETDLSVVAADSINALREEAARVGSEVTMHVQGRPMGIWDRTRIAQVCTNLLTNAIKYGAGKPITVRVWLNGDDAFLSVEDQGIGIPPDQQKRIFGRFERAVSARHYGGLGLGLYICRQIVEAHGGSIHLTSIQGQGTTFTVTLPKTRPIATT